jgi:pimeloyl-ACP methyl ester carboxylesterase
MLARDGGPGMATIVLVHGAWMNPASWGGWKARYEARGHTVLAPAWPHDDRPPAELRAQPAPELARIGIGEIVDHYDAVVRALPEPPILVGHSFGGLFVQMLLGRGLGRVGVAIHPAPPRGVQPTLDAIRAGLPVLATFRPGSRVHTMSFADFRWGWVHTLPEADQRAAYDAFVVPTPGRPYVQAAAAPFTRTLAVDFAKPDRAPLLIVAGGLDRTVSASMNRQNYELYAASPALRAYREWPERTHFTIGQPGWEEVADAVLAWAEQPVAS